MAYPTVTPARSVSHGSSYCPGPGVCFLLGAARMAQKNPNRKTTLVPSSRVLWAVSLSAFCKSESGSYRRSRPRGNNLLFTFCCCCYVQQCGAALPTKQLVYDGRLVPPRRSSRSFMVMPAGTNKTMEMILLDVFLYEPCWQNKLNYYFHILPPKKL